MIELYFKETSQSDSPSAHAILEQILWEQYGIPHPVFFRNEQGKLSCENGPQFNLSHTKGAILLGFSDCPIGVDVERLRSIVSTVPSRVLSDAEYRWFREAGSRPEDFFTLWTLKESYYKQLGTGLPGFPNETQLFLGPAGWNMAGESCFFWNHTEKNLFLAVCSEKEAVVNFHRL